MHSKQSVKFAESCQPPTSSPTRGDDQQVTCSAARAAPLMSTTLQLRVSPTPLRIVPNIGHNEGRWAGICRNSVSSIISQVSISSPMLLAEVLNQIRGIASKRRDCILSFNHRKRTPSTAIIFLLLTLTLNLFQLSPLSLLADAIEQIDPTSIQRIHLNQQYRRQLIDSLAAHTQNDNKLQQQLRELRTKSPEKSPQFARAVAHLAPPAKVQPLSESAGSKPIISNQLFMSALQMGERQARERMERNQQEIELAPYWTRDLPTPSIGEAQFASLGERFPSSSQQEQFYSYRPLGEPDQAANHQIAGNHQPTAPTINRQLIAPPPFYELGLRPTNVLQLEQVGEEPAGSRATNTNTAFNQPQPGRLASGRALASTILRAANATGTLQPASGANRNGKAVDQANSPSRDANLATSASESIVARQPQDSAASESDQAAANNSGGGEQSGGEKVSPSADKSIEPRQRRRIFNRILKKAEWNHLFMELSKVFLRYFLDLALKDIIGKQSGVNLADSTTSRKKLDAQSELADLLKDFVKTAISNI